MPRLTRARTTCLVRCLLVFALLSMSPAFADTPVAASSAAAPAVPDTLQQRMAACVACHGAHGEGSPGSGFFPRLAGKPAGYLVRQLADFQSGLRKYAPMEYTVRGLSPDYLREIAGYFAAQQVPYARSPLPAWPAQTLERGEQLVAQGDASRGIPACSRCHGSQLTGVQPDIPGLVGLPYDYISAQLGAWRTHTRATVAPDCMAEVAGRLSESDITAVAAWLSSHELPADMHAQPAGSVQPPLHCGVLSGNGAGT
ncbi:c-type cytochrome [Rhodanobacter sp. DHG33]|uniref:c-type cytochrome n=1 Tax=Rhodanobacter sp. DHG33 TaxID=2775921 RepID=UPI00177F135D|nr:c-type cytochrome [Rhodanobacter sp. DHG33]MBD8899379.1 c-type cytochrome [Rhodanobacter sp. DHG33]